MYKKILVPLDGSERAESILSHVEELACLFSARIILLQVFELPHLINLPRKPDEPYSALPELSMQTLQKQTEDAEAYLAERALALRARGLQTEHRVAYGPIVATILQTADTEAVDLIAMASHGRGGLKGVFYGSVAAGVLQRVDRPLLIVRAQSGCD
jgi:nucleotide-binding universal stress UspA family protein